MKDSRDLVKMDQMGMFSKEVRSADISIQAIALLQRGWAASQRYRWETTHGDGRSQALGTTTVPMVLGSRVLPQTHHCHVFVQPRPL